MSVSPFSGPILQYIFGTVGPDVVGVDLLGADGARLPATIGWTEQTERGYYVFALPRPPPPSFELIVGVEALDQDGWAVANRPLELHYVGPEEMDEETRPTPPPVDYSFPPSGPGC